MKYILYDDITGNVIGLDYTTKHHDKKSNWKTLSDEDYEFLLNHNGEYYIDLSKIDDTRTEDPFITKDMLKSVIDRSIEGAIINTIRKNSIYCEAYIKNGCSITLDDGTEKRHTYDEHDQLNIEQINILVDKGILTKDIPIKFHEDDEYSFISVSEFKKLYNELLKNKYFQLFYLRKYNDYLRTLTDENKLRRLNYETGLPIKERKEIINMVNEIFKGGEYND